MKIIETANEWPEELKRQYDEQEQKEYDEGRCSAFFKIERDDRVEWTWCNDDDWSAHLGSSDGGPHCSFCGKKV